MAYRLMKLASAFALPAFCLAPTTGAHYQGAKEKSIHIQIVDFPRPVQAAVLEIERHFGSVVTYEDTRYVDPSDIVDVTEQVRRDGNMANRVLGRRGRTIDLTYVPRSTTTESQVGEVLQEVVTRWNAESNAGEFRVEQVAGGYHVVPAAIRGKSGVTEAYTPLLDTRISLPYQEENGLEMISRITRAVTTNSGHALSAGLMPINGLERARVAIEAHNEPARDVLWRSLQSISPRLSWQLLCDVGETGACALSVHAVPSK